MKKKVLALLLAMALTMGMSTVAFAATQYTITINDNASDTTIHTYDAYQIFSGTLTEKGGKKGLEGIKWGSGIQTGSSFTYDGVSYNTSIQQDAAQLALALSSKADAKDLAVAIQSVLSDTKVSKSQDDKDSAVVFTLDEGYYLIKDNAVSGYGAVSDYIVNVAGPVTVSPKMDVPSTLKWIQDINDSTDLAYSDDQRSADYDIGDAVPFKFESVVPEKAATYDNAYKFIFHDTMSKGLTFNPDSVVVKVGDSVLTSGYAVSVGTANDNGGSDFTITIDDLRESAGKKVVVTYNATLNGNAVIGPVGNPNTMYLEFSNNPHGTGTGKTPKSTVVAFTYKVEVNKVDENGDALTGAEFQLQKLYISKDADGNVISDWKTIAVVKNNAGTVFTFNGIDDGTYRLSETTTPGGYNSIPDKYVYFNVIANHVVMDGTANAYVAPSAAMISDISGFAAEGEATTHAGSYKFTQGVNDGGLSTGAVVTSIMNQSGSLLPSTGGIGTTIFYVIGGSLIVLGGAMLFVKRKMSRSAE